MHTSGYKVALGLAFLASMSLGEAERTVRKTHIACTSRSPKMLTVPQLPSYSSLSVVVLPANALPQWCVPS